MAWAVPPAQLLVPLAPQAARWMVRVAAVVYQWGAKVVKCLGAPLVHRRADLGAMYQWAGRP